LSTEGVELFSKERSYVMARKGFVFFAMGMIIFFFVSLASADVPHMISYQGKLTTASGGCLNDTVQMTFSIYPDTLGSPADWTETQTEVVVKEGIFNVLLGAVDTIPQAVFDGSVKYLGVQVEADPEMRPLKPMVSVPYAYRAGTADIGGDAGGWVDDGGVVRLETDTDQVGIGTATPEAKLDVNDRIRVAGDWARIELLSAPNSVAGKISQDGSGHIKVAAPVGAGNVVLETQGTGRLSVKQDGTVYTHAASSVGIGTEWPEARLHVDQSGIESGPMGLKVGPRWASGNPYNTGTQRIMIQAWDGSAGLSLVEHAVGGYLIQNDGADLAFKGDWDGSGGEKVRITETGNVGIGTAVPKAKLHISSTEWNLDYRALAFGDAGDTTYYFDAKFAGSGPTGNWLTLGDTWSNKIQTWRDGNVGIGTESPSAKLDVVGSINTDSDYKIQGARVLSSLGTLNAFVGRFAGRDNTSGTQNTFVGSQAGLRNTTGVGNTYVGAGAGEYNLNGHGNVFVGAFAGDTEMGSNKLVIDNTYSSTPFIYGEFDNRLLVIDGSTTTDVLEITGGSDLAEKFEIRQSEDDLAPEPGMVACIDPEHPGELVISTKPYDPTVAGIVSGAGGLKPGMLMGQQSTVAHGEHPVALTGRAWCLADASSASIKPGDFLTTSIAPGHAMKAVDRDRAYGAVIGKAMTALEDGRGLVLVLVNLQ
jgi:hypothetical protein